LHTHSTHLTLFSNNKSFKQTHTRILIHSATPNYFQVTMVSTAATSGHGQIWFITGANKGIGLEIARAALDAGHTVIGAVRSGKSDEIKSSKLHWVSLDVTDEASVKRAAAEATEIAGRVDVVVNNAGNVLAGALEEVSLAQVRAQYDTNVFGTIAVTKAFLPQLRKQGSGHVVNLSSAFGRVSVPGWGLYASTKYAVEAISEALSGELSKFGVKVILIEPGYTRTPILSSGTTYGANTLPDVYDAIRPTKAQIEGLSGTQQGDPARQGKAIVKLVADPNTPLHVPLGSDSYGYITGTLKAVLDEVTPQKEHAASTDFPK